MEKIESSKIYIQKMIFIASLVLLLIIKLRFPKGKSIHREIQKYIAIQSNGKLFQISESFSELVTFF